MQAAALSGQIQPSAYTRANKANAQRTKAASYGGISIGRRMRLTYHAIRSIAHPVGRQLIAQMSGRPPT